jgi:carbamoyl-phosphate synthase large subunit
MRLSKLSKKGLPVLVTAIGGGGNGEQILKALRLANDGRYRIVGADANPRSPQFGLVDCAVVLPHASDPSYLDAVFDAIDKHRIQAIFCGCEAELKLFSLERKKFAQRGVFLPINQAKVINLCMDKLATSRALSNLGYQCPRYSSVSSRNELKAVNFYPVIVKPSVGGGGSASVYLAQNQKELFGLAEYLGLGSRVFSFLVQEYVGTPEEEFTVGVLHDLEGSYLNAIAVRRTLTGQMNIRMSVPNRTGKAHLGPRLVVSSGISQGFVGRFPQVTTQCAEIARSLGSKGPMNIQCRFVSGKVMIFEINPRFSGTTSIRAMMGYNEPDVLIRRHVFGERIKADFAYREGFVSRSIVEIILDK